MTKMSGILLTGIFRDNYKKAINSSLAVHSKARGGGGSTDIRMVRTRQATGMTKTRPKNLGSNIKSRPKNLDV